MEDTELFFFFFLNFKLISVHNEPSAKIINIKIRFVNTLTVRHQKNKLNSLSKLGNLPFEGHSFFLGGLPTPHHGEEELKPRLLDSVGPTNHLWPVLTLTQGKSSLSAHGLKGKLFPPSCKAYTSFLPFQETLSFLSKQVACVFIKLGSVAPEESHLLKEWWKRLVLFRGVLIFKKCPVKVMIAPKL